MTVNPIKTFQFGLMDISILIRLNQDKELVKISHVRVSVAEENFFIRIPWVFQFI